MATEYEEVYWTKKAEVTLIKKIKDFLALNVGYEKQLKMLHSIMRSFLPSQRDSLCLLLFVSAEY